jgi:hypothetical protein
MRRYLMACRGDAPYKIRKTFRNPAKHEKRPQQLGFVEDLEQPVGVAADAAVECVPFGSTDAVLERGDLEIILHVDGHGVHDGTRRASGNGRPER